MAIIEISIIPVGTGTSSVSEYVAGAVCLLQDEEGIKYELTAMGTIIEGDLERLLALTGKMHRSALDAGAGRVVTTVKIDERRDKQSSASDKVASVKQKLVR
jgi:uncharacterized protein (TIGR00106 family)